MAPPNANMPSPRKEKSWEKFEEEGVTYKEILLAQTGIEKPQKKFDDFLSLEQAGIKTP